MNTRPTSIRIHLTIWYSAILACGLFLFAVSVWVLLKHALYNGLQNDLSKRTSSLVSFVIQESSEPGVHLKEELEEYCHALPEGTSFWLVNTVDHKVFASNAALPFPTQEGPTPKYSMSKTWLLPSFLLSRKSVLLVGIPYEITGVVSATDARAILHQLGALLLTLAPGVLLMLSLGGFILSRRALKPVDEITGAAQSLSIRDLSRRLPVARTGDELQRLSETWNSMLDRVQEAVQRLTRFTQDASHELRTPLAIIRSTAEIASRRSRSEEAYRRAFTQIIEESDRLTALVEDLLLLARGDQPAHAEMQKVSLRSLVSDVCQEMATLSEQKAITITKELSSDSTLLFGNPLLIRRLLFVLLENAIQYSPDMSVVAVRLRMLGEFLEVSVQDEGPGIADCERAHIFERFYRGETARQVWSNGAGLGLSIAASIAQQHQADIEVNSEPGRGSTFAVKFPAAAARTLSVL